MPIPDPKRAALQDQVNAKIKWNSTDAEVSEWLSEKHFIRGTDAAEMIEAGKRHRAGIVRERSFYGMIISAVGTLVTGGIVVVQWWGGYFYLRRGTIMLVACAFCAAWFLRYTYRFLSGKSVIAE